MKYNNELLIGILKFDFKKRLDFKRINENIF